MAEYKKPKWMQRYRYSTAYIDSYVVVLQIIAASCLAAWIAYETRNIINPWWLGVSIITIFLYVLLVLWLLKQFHNIDRIFMTYTTGIICLGLIVSLVAYITGVRLPTDLPVLDLIVYLSGLQIESFDPGSVAISYAFIVGLLAILITVPFILLDNTKPVRYIVKKLRLDAVDYIIDRTLDYVGYRLDAGKYGWLAVLLTMIIIVCTIVVGGASLI